MILALLALIPFIPHAQQATCTIIGVVQDAAGSVIPKAFVTLSHPATGETRMVRTNERGEYTSAFMRIGEYIIAAEASGSKEPVVSGINLTNTPTFFLPSATNAALTIGNASFGKLTSSSATGGNCSSG
jgi:hypothetical protein